jgi:hypothetical protein
MKYMAVAGLESVIFYNRLSLFFNYIYILCRVGRYASQIITEYVS